jgi:hypothetical protein
LSTYTKNGPMITLLYNRENGNVKERLKWVADSVWLSLFMDDTGMCTSLSRIQYLNIKKWRLFYNFSFVVLLIRVILLHFRVV